MDLILKSSQRCSELISAERRGVKAAFSLIKHSRTQGLLCGRRRGWAGHLAHGLVFLGLWWGGGADTPPTAWMSLERQALTSERVLESTPMPLPNLLLQSYQWLPHFCKEQRWRGGSLAATVAVPADGKQLISRF